MVNQDLLPNLSKEDFEDAMVELKMNYNFDENEVHRSAARPVDVITKEFLLEIDLTSADDHLP